MDVQTHFEIYLGKNRQGEYKLKSAIHEGYEYQDYFTVSIILQQMLHQTDAEIIIDRKDFCGDKFDDLKVKLPNGITEFQIKYSDDESNHTLTKDDFANGNGHDTALSDLFMSWKTRKESEDITQMKLCLAWNKPTDDDPIAEFLQPIQDKSLPFLATAYVFDGNLFWPVGKRPPSTWRKFSSEIKSKHISREDFISFCNELTIFTDLPKASLDLKNPGSIERIMISQVEKLGVGIYPNDNLETEEIINKLATEVKHSRAIGNRLYINSLSGRLGIVIDYGKFDQRFPVDSAHKIILDDELKRLQVTIQNFKRVILSGNPGSGKSWIVDEYINRLKNDNHKVIHYNCFHSLQDEHSLERIRVTSLYGNLVSQIVEQCPELVEYKRTTFGADKAELENLLQLINEDFYLVVDGIDHISREYELHKDFISRAETEIISELLEIYFPENCYILISSQPIEALEDFKENKYAVFEIEPWGIEQTQSLIASFHISDGDFGDDESLSLCAYLLSKSQGNPLYLSYVLRQLRNTVVNKELIDEIPDYDISLSQYYAYLYTKISNNRTVYALCGADFYLSPNDLKEITGDGEFVEQDIQVLHPLLIENVLSGGFSIYHESFRRFVLSSLEEKKVDLDRNVYGILADWLQKKPFFEFDKAFYYLPELLYKGKRDDDNIALIKKEFVLNAVAEGYSRKRIRMNLHCIIRSASRAKNLVALVTSSELLAMLDDLNEFESTGEEYLQAICDIKDASKLNQLMQIDGKPAFDKNTGRLACYISSKAGINPWWELYIDKDTQEVLIEDYKYYIRYSIDEKGIGIIPKIMETIENEDALIRNQCITDAFNEIVDYIDVDEIASIAEEQQLNFWKYYLSYIETGYYPQSDVSVDATISNWAKIKKMNIPGKDDIDILREFFSQVYYLAVQGDSKTIERIIFECENRNWFYNWIIYAVKMAELNVYRAQMDSQAICETVIANLEILLQDTDVFKGTPRTCDLYFVQSELTRSYEQAVEMVLRHGTLKDFDKVLGILDRLDDETGTSLDHIMGGPLTDSELLKLLTRYLTVDNYETARPYLLKIQGRIEKNEVYDSVAAAKLRFASLISKYNRSEALEYYDIGIHYLVAYGFHKDIILEQIMDPYNIFYESVPVNPREERNTITKMTIALLNHTDGRETRYFLNNWFDKLLEIDPKYAIALLYELQIKQGRSWIVERMLLSAIEKYCKDPDYQNIIISLIESLPNDTSPRLIDAATSVLGTINPEEARGTYEESLIKYRAKELVVNVISRFNILDRTWLDSDSWIEGSIKELLSTAETYGIDVSQYLDYFNANKNDDTNNIEFKKVDYVKDSLPSIDSLNLERVKKWIETTALTERYIPDICELLKNYQNDKGVLLEMLRFIITKVAGGWNYNQKRKQNVLKIIEQFELDTKEMSEIHMLLYLYSYEWGSSLIDTDEFQKSIHLNPEVARETFYQELPIVTITQSGRITKGLFGALFKIGFDRDGIVTIWKNVFDIMKLRFPNLDQYSIDCELEETKEILGLRNCVLMRFVDGGKEQFLATYAYLANAAEEKNYSEFVDSILFCLEHYKQFNLVTKIAIADLISCYGNRIGRENINLIIDAINDVYPTGNLLLDVIFSRFTVYKNFLSWCPDKHGPDYMDQEDIEFYLREQLYDLGKEKIQEGIDEYAKNAIYRDSIMCVVNQCGINYEEIYKKLHSSEKLSDQLRDFVSPRTKVSECNTVYKSYVIQYALHAIIEKAYFEKKPELVPQSLLLLKPNYQRMYRLFKCREIQPSNHQYDKENSCKPFIRNDEEEYILIGSFEAKKEIDHQKASIVCAYQGIVGEEDEENQSPLRQYLVTTFGRRENNLISDNVGAVIDLCWTLDRELEDDVFLLPATSVSDLLNVYIEFDFLQGRYIAVNQEKDIVFIMKTWSSSYLGDSDYAGNSIPLYTGSMLYIKKEYIPTLEQRFGTLIMRKYVESYTQSY